MIFRRFNGTYAQATLNPFKTIKNFLFQEFPKRVCATINKYLVPYIFGPMSLWLLYTLLYKSGHNNHIHKWSIAITFCGNKMCNIKKKKKRAKHISFSI